MLPNVCCLSPGGGLFYFVKKSIDKNRGYLLVLMSKEVLLRLIMKKRRKLKLIFRRCANSF